MRVLLIAGNLITLRAGVLDVGQWFAPHGWFAPVTIYEIVIVILFATTLAALGMLSARERRDLAREDPSPALARHRGAAALRQ
jgi:hypothetical protein